MSATPAWRRPYLRPDASWRCGRAASCPLGPSLGGACRGATPCQPRRTWLGLRRRLSLGALGATLALFALVGASPSLRAAALDPGPLTPAHAALARECADCHAAAEGGALGLVRQAWTRLREGDATHADDRRCLECHDQGPHALEPHGLSPTRLALARVTSASPTLLQRGARALFSGAPSVSCAECHVEHQGAAADLRALADASCQACHSAPFASFAEGHPELGADFGQRAAERVRFDHAQHLGLGVVPADEARFSAEGGRAPDCRECHALDGAQRHVVLRDHVFERWCAECHSGSELAPLKVLRFPAAPVAWIGSDSLPPWSLRLEREPDLLPKDSSPEPLQRALLRDPDQGPKSLQRLAERFQEYALEPIEDEAVSSGEWDGSVDEDMRADYWESDEEIARAEREEAAWQGPARAYLRDTALLLEELSEPSRLGERWRALAPRGRPETAQRWGQAWPQALLQRLRGAWLAPERPALDPPEDELRARGAGTWQLEGARLSYRDYGHSDPFLRGWFDLAGELQRGSPREELHLRAVQGRCDTCHTLGDPARGGLAAPRWRVAWRAPEQPGGYFAHGPHLGLVEQGCQSCHAPRAEQEGRGDFALVGYATRQDCASCHTPAQAGAGCTQCHDYHRGAAGSTRVSPGGGGSHGSEDLRR